MTRCFQLALALLVSVGCKNSAKPSDSASPAAEPIVDRPASPLFLQPDDAPASVFAVGVVPNPSAQVAGLRAFLAPIDPSLASDFDDAMLDGAMGWLFGGPALPGIDHDEPVYVLLVNPQRPIAMVVTVKDDTALREWAASSGGRFEVEIREGRAFIASPSEVPNIGNYAFGPLLAAPVPERPTVIAFAKPILSVYRSQVRAYLTGYRQMLANTAGGRLMPAFANLFGDALLDQLRAVTLELAVDEGGAAVIVGLHGAPKTALADFASRQRPSRYDVMARVPVKEPTYAMAGKIDFESVMDGYLGMMPEVLGFGADSATRGAAAELMKQMEGELAVAGDISGGMTMAYLFETGDSERAMQSIRRLSTELNRTGAAMSYKLVGSPAFVHEGVAVDEFELVVDQKRLPEAQQAAVQPLVGGSLHYTSAGWPGLHLSILAPDARELTRAAIDALAQPAPTRGYVGAEQVTASRERKESVFVWFDIGRLLSNMQPEASPLDSIGVEFGLGFTPDAALVRLAMSRDSVRALVSLPPPSRSPELVSAVKELADRACECKDVACIEARQGELTSLVKASRQPNKAEQDLILKDMERMAECRARLVD